VCTVTNVVTSHVHLHLPSGSHTASAVTSPGLSQRFSGLRYLIKAPTESKSGADPCTCLGGMVVMYIDKAENRWSVPLFLLLTNYMATLPRSKAGHKLSSSIVFRDKCKGIAPHVLGWPRCCAVNRIAQNILSPPSTSPMRPWTSLRTLEGLHLCQLTH